MKNRDWVNYINKLDNLSDDQKAMISDKCGWEYDFRLKRMEVGLNINTLPSAFDAVLTADFDDEAGLNAYRTHPEHVKVLGFLKETMEKSAVVDYWI